MDILIYIYIHIHTYVGLLSRDDVRKSFDGFVGECRLHGSSGLFYTASEFGEFPLVKTQWVPLKNWRFNA